MATSFDDRGSLRRVGGCLCGAVRFSVVGDPLRIGLCHCGDCRKASGAGFSMFAIWLRGSFDAAGHFATFGGRSFCSICGSRLFSLRPDEAEIMIGALDAAPTDLVPSYEVWIRRRERWLQQLPWADQFDEDRIDAEGSWRQALRPG